jgi:hypothetical protein
MDMAEKKITIQILTFGPREECSMIFALLESSQPVATSTGRNATY